MPKRISILTLASAMLLGLPAQAQMAPDSVKAGDEAGFTMTPLASGLENPFEITLGPDGWLWVTERTGKRITRVNTADGTTTPVLTIEDAVAGEAYGQSGVLGLALHPDFGKGTDQVFVAYSYDDAVRTDLTVPDADSPLRHTFIKIARYDWDGTALSNPQTLIEGLPANVDHVAGRLKFAPDGMLHLTLGDQGHNQLANACRKNEAQRLPSASEVAMADYAAYVGKTLRLNADGSIPADNPVLAGVRSHVFTYGHRNPQGIDFAPDGRLYSSEQGPKTDDELNLLVAGGNYGWPDVAGLQDDKAYVWASWANATTPCADLTFSDLEIPDAVPQVPETAFSAPENYHTPIATMFTVENDYNFADPACGGMDYICWPTIAPASVQVYAGDAIPQFANSLLIPTLKRGSLYVIPLDGNGSVTEPFHRFFHSDNRLRDTEISADGKTIWIATDSAGLFEGTDGTVKNTPANPGAILTYSFGQ